MTKLKLLFGKRLRRLRRRADFTQEQLAEQIGVSVEFVSNMERGINAPSFETLEKLADSLKLKVNELFEFQSEDWRA
jgi:transcriptional regulator with XRE-family HTH domain